MRLGRTQDAFRVYEEAVELGLFPSVYQRSTYNLDGLAARPWWTLTQTRCSKHLKARNAGITEFSLYFRTLNVLGQFFEKRQ